MPVHAPGLRFGLRESASPSLLVTYLVPAAPKRPSRPFLYELFNWSRWWMRLKQVGRPRLRFGYSGVWTEILINEVFASRC
jgi:hypothetical protein